jgi:dTDP-4-dehydrorhamnose reductase
MRVAITGTTGRVGAALASHLVKRHEVIRLPRTVCDLASPSSLRRVLDSLECDVFINPAAITSLETCDADPDLAMRVNAEAPEEIAAWAASRGIRVMHFSTDYVFGGQLSGYRTESESPAPVSVYGSSKLAGESAVLAHEGNLVLRVSWVFGPEKPSFVDQIVNAALAGKPLAAVADKFSLPTLTTDLAGWVDRLIESDATGLLHACNPGNPVSWHGLAAAVIEEMASCGLLRQVPEIAELQLRKMESFRADRPRFTAMDTRRLSAALGKPLRPWPVALSDYVRSQYSGLRKTGDCP